MQLFSNNQPMLPSMHAIPRVQNEGVRRHRPLWAVRLVVCLIVVTSVGVASPTYGQDIDREYKLKAAYLYKFATYIKWPKRSFRNATSPFVIGILGPDPVGSDLRKIARVKTIGGRKIEVRNYNKAEEIGGCQILFLSKALNSETRQAAIKLLSGKNILLVGETADFLKHGGVFGFAIRNNRIRINISQSAYKREHLEISAQLLRIATVF